VNKKLLISKMKFYGDIYNDLAQYLGISLSRVTAKINETSGAEFNQGEIRKIRNRYKLSDEEVISIFFTEDVSCKDTNIKNNNPEATHIKQ